MRVMGTGIKPGVLIVDLDKSVHPLMDKLLRLGSYQHCLMFAGITKIRTLGKGPKEGHHPSDVNDRLGVILKS